MSSTTTSSPPTSRGCARRDGRCGTTTRWSTTAEQSFSLRSLGRDSLIYGLGPVVSRFISLPLVFLYVKYLDSGDFGRIETVVALVAVGATLAQLGLVNAMFRFAAEREGDARYAVVRTCLAGCLAAGIVISGLAALLTPLVSGSLGTSLWLIGCAGLLISLIYEPTVGLYRIEREPVRYLRITLVNVLVTVLASVLAVVVFQLGAPGLLGGSYTGTAVALVLVAADRRRELSGPIDRELVRPLLSFGLPFLPSRLALWGLNLSNRLLLGWLVGTSAVGVLGLGARVASLVMLMVTAFQLAWPPFAYGIADDERARRTYRAVLTWWLAIALTAALGLALLRDPIVRAIASFSENAGQWRGAGNVLAWLALGIAFYGAYYVVGVAVGRVKQTQLNWIVTGIAALANVALCALLIPHYGASGAAAATAIAYALMAVLMVVRGNRVFPVGYDWPRVGALLALAGVLFAAGELLPVTGAGPIAGRTALALAFAPGALALIRWKELPHGS